MESFGLSSHDDDDDRVSAMAPDPDQLTNLWKLFKLLAIICAVGTVLFTMYHFYQMLRHWTLPTIQTITMRVLLLPATWAVLALVLVFEPDLRFVIYVFLDLMEAFCILSFMQLVYAYLGGKAQARSKAENKPVLRVCCVIPITPSERLMKILHWFIYQFVLFRPFLAVLTCVLYYENLYEEGFLNGSPLPLIFTLLLLVSLILLLFGLLQVYRIFKLILTPKNIGYKFAVIKFFILCHIVQSFVFTAINTFTSKKFHERNPNPTPQQLYVLNLLGDVIIAAEGCLLCIEMVLAAFFNMVKFFSYKEFMENENEVLALTSGGNRVYNGDGSGGNDSPTDDEKPATP